jgi:predicted RNA binding protein YcfA (HicA-like mRNA interferase family)
VLKREGFRVTVAYHNKPLKRGTLASIIRQAGLTVEQFNEMV